MNTAFLLFRLRQLGKVVREIPVLYLLILFVILCSGGIALYSLSESLTGCLVTGAIFLGLTSLLHLRRKDYHFILLAEEKPWKVFCMDYLLLAIPVLIILFLHLHWYAICGIICGCLGIGFIKQPFHRTSRGITPPRFIPAEAFELRSGIRQQGGILVFLYVSAWVGLLFPLAALASLWFFTIFCSEIFRYTESTKILLAQELNAPKFLHRKMFLYLKLYLLAILPVCAVHLVLYPVYWWVVVLFLFGSAQFILLSITTKYAYFRPQIKVTTGQIPLILALMSILMPFFLPVVLIFLIRSYSNARRHLTPYLYAYHSELTGTI